MKTEILINRRQRVQRLTKLAMQDKNTLKVFQGYRLISDIDKSLTNLTNMRNCFVGRG